MNCNSNNNNYGYKLVPICYDCGNVKHIKLNTMKNKIIEILNSFNIPVEDTTTGEINQGIIQPFYEELAKRIDAESSTKQSMDESKLLKALIYIKDIANRHCNNFEAYNDTVYLTAKEAIDTYKPVKQPQVDWEEI